MTDATLVALRNCAALIAAHADEAERERRLARPVVGALINNGLFRILLPVDLGGAGRSPLEFCEMIDAVSAMDGATGWCVMIGAGYGHFAGLLPPSAAAEIFGDSAAVVAGTFRPTGTARAVTGGYHVSGQWPLASGSSHATWLLGGCRVLDGDQPRLTSNGKPELRLVLFPTGDATILDTWYSAGLRGTASHDFVVHDCFVPERRACWFSQKPVRSEPQYRLPVIAFLAAGVASVPLGIASHALALFKSLAEAKTPKWSQSRLREKTAAQLAAGQADGLVRGRRAFLTETVRDAWATVMRGGALSWEQPHSNFEIAGQLALGLDVRQSVWSIDDRGDA